MASTTGIKLDEATKKRLKELAAARNRSSHWLMKTAILQFLDREEAYEAEKREDMERWEAYCETGEHIGNQAMMDWLDELER